MYGAAAPGIHHRDTESTELYLLSPLCPPCLCGAIYLVQEIFLAYLELRLL